MSEQGVGLVVGTAEWCPSGVLAADPSLRMSKKRVMFLRRRSRPFSLAALGRMDGRTCFFDGGRPWRSGCRTCFFDGGPNF